MSICHGSKVSIRETGDLAPGAVPILKLCAEEKVEGVAAELMQSMIEVKTGVCCGVQEAKDQLLPVLRRVRIFAASLGYELALGGTHPFHRSTASTVFPAERYERIMERLAWLTYQAGRVQPARSCGRAGRRFGHGCYQPARQVPAAPLGPVGELAVLARSGHGVGVRPNRPVRQRGRLEGTALESRSDPRSGNPPL
jgi:hypothetical protein